MRSPIEKWLDNYKLKRKLQIFYVACVLFPLIVTDSMILINVLVPWIISVYMHNSLTRRMRILGEAFKSVTDDRLTEIQEITGKDELSALMYRYNQMAERTNDLIEKVYKAAIRKQEMEIARKNAELLALQSQINPHFMFNTLERIRTA